MREQAEGNACLLGPLAAAELRALYEALDAEVAALSPVCRLSGRCCRFNEYGHTLFVSAAEVQLLLQCAPRPCRPLDRGQTCPWQNESGHCTARNCRPLGCRVYYCDPAFAPSAFDLSERYIARLKTFTNKHGLPWSYAPLHHHLDRARTAAPSLFDQVSSSRNERESSPTAPETVSPAANP